MKVGQSPANISKTFAVNKDGAKVVRPRTNLKYEAPPCVSKIHMCAKRPHHCLRKTIRACSHRCIKSFHYRIDILPSKKAKRVLFPERESRKTSATTSFLTRKRLISCLFFPRRILKFLHLLSYHFWENCTFHVSEAWDDIRECLWTKRSVTC